MAYRLPDNTLIIVPRRDRSFIIAGVQHPELNLLRWDVQNLLGNYGITKEADPTPPVYNPTLEELKAEAKQLCKDALVAKLQGDFDNFERLLIVQEFARGDATKRAQIGEVWDWENNLIDEFLTLLTSINQAADAAAVQAIVWDFSLWDGTKPAYTIKELLE